MWLGITLLALAGALVWLLRKPRRGRADAAERDETALRAAEAEVRDLDAMTPPDEADQCLTDWGPGAPR
jgi:Tfp pilus assembly protein PilX